MPARLTQHAGERGKQRLHLPVKAMVRLATHAYDRGAQPADFVGSFRRFLDSCALKARCQVRVHGEYVYIFDMADAKLITVIPVPSRFRALLRRIKAREKES